jgi:hypothetical protein
MLSPDQDLAAAKPQDGRILATCDVFNLSADQGDSLVQFWYVVVLFSMVNSYRYILGNARSQVRLVVEEHNRTAQVQLAFCLFSGLFCVFDFTEGRTTFEPVLDPDRFAAILLESL